MYEKPSPSLQAAYSIESNMRGQALQMQKGSLAKWLSNVLPSSEFSISWGQHTAKVEIWPAAFTRYKPTVTALSSKTAPVYELSFNPTTGVVTKLKCQSWDAFPGTYTHSRATKEGLLPNHPHSNGQEEGQDVKLNLSRSI